MICDRSSRRSLGEARRDFTNIGRRGFAGHAVEPRAIRILVVITMAKIQSRAPATFARWVTRLGISWRHSVVAAG